MSATEKARGTHSFKITDYSLHKGLGVGKFIDSGTFAVGGYEWHLRYYPDGFREGTKEYVGVFLRIVTKGGVEVVKVVFDLRIVNQATGASSSVFSSPRQLFTTNQTGAGGAGALPNSCRGASWKCHRLSGMTASSLNVMSL
jgi:speckle-type POZ protein